jgi:Zn-dependent M16 (insulinase) family peptidase
MENSMHQLGNPLESFTTFHRRLTVVQGKIQLSYDFSTGDQEHWENRIWLASSLKMIDEGSIFECKSLELVIFEADSKLSRFEGSAFYKSA